MARSLPFAVLLLTSSCADWSDAVVETTSCTSLPATCGSSGTDSCCASPVVPGGAFSRSFDGVNAAPRDEPAGGYKNPNYTATVGDFRLDLYEVSVGRFRAFVNAKAADGATLGLGTLRHPPHEGDGAHERIPGSGWSESWNAPAPDGGGGAPHYLALDTESLKATLAGGPNSTWREAGNDNLPMNCVTWYEAFAFCIWDGGYLPTEAEWNYAAAGGNRQLQFPWGAADPACPTSMLANCHGMGTALVGSLSPAGDGRFGHADLAGNVEEWTLDFWSQDYAGAPPPCASCADVADPGTAPFRVVRGGSFVDGTSSLLASVRRFSSAIQRNPSNGLRCARPPLKPR